MASIHLLGGEWNLLPEAVVSSKLPEKFGCAIAAHPAETATHISKTVANILDFFLVSRALALGLKNVGVVTSAKIGRTGPQLHFSTRAQLRWRSSNLPR